MTARSTGLSNASSARSRSAFRISAEISTGERALPRGGFALTGNRHPLVGRAEIDADRQRALAGMRQWRFTRLVDLQQSHALDRSRFMRRARASSANLS